MKPSKITLRILFIALSLMAIVSVIMGGYLYYSALRKSLFESSHKEVEEQVRILKNEIDSNLAWSLLSVKSLAGLKEMQQSLSKGDQAAHTETNAILDHFRDTLKIDVCYLLDRSGNTIASSNRDSLDSFVGKNYGFRPYFKQAMLGDPAVFMALGVTSKTRGVYFSHPVYGNEKDRPSGVVVIKSSIEMIQRDFKKPFNGIIMLTDPHGVVFVSSRTDWLYHLLWEPSLDTISNIARTRQFGPGPWNWTEIKPVGKDKVVDKSGAQYHLHQHGLANYPGWQLVYLDKHDEIMKKITKSLQKSVGAGVLLLSVLSGLIVLFLFTKANAEIIQRKKAEKEQKLSLSKLTAALESTTDGILVMDKNGKTSASNKLFAKMWNIPDDLLESRVDDKSLAYVLDQLKNPDDFIKKVEELYADPDAKSFDTLYFKDGRILERYSQPQTLDKQVIGRVWSFRDITEKDLVQKEREKLIIDLQNALDEVKTLKGILPICSHCKQIRDDKGSWNKIEAYIQKRSDAKFSHSICPDCAKELYPDFDIYD
jgi:C4-dicarboxylate-specific signal transduction histidine kinase